MARSPELKNMLKRALALNPCLYHIAWMLHDLRKPVYPLINAAEIDASSDQRRVFDSIYKAELWGCAESKSGYGSTLAFTEQLRKDLRDLVQSYGITSLLDAPCGDFNWMRHTELPGGLRYIGGDIVKELVHELSLKHENGRRTFLELDISRDELPEVDLWLCRDCLFHLSNS